MWECWLVSLSLLQQFWNHFIVRPLDLRLINKRFWVQILLSQQYNIKTKWDIPGLFFHNYHLFKTVERKQKFNTNFADDWIQTADLWCQMWPLCHLRHNHFTYKDNFDHKQNNWMIIVEWKLSCANGVKTWYLFWHHFHFIVPFGFDFW